MKIMCQEIAFPNFSRVILLLPWLIAAAGGDNDAIRPTVQEQATGHRAVVEQTVVISSRAADKHVFQHLFNRRWRTGVADKIGTKLPHPGLTERHIVTQDFHLTRRSPQAWLTSCVTGGFHVGVQFNVAHFFAADNALLLLDGQGVQPAISCKYF